MPITPPEALINAVAQADANRRSRTPGTRQWFEPFFNLLGRLWGGVLFLLPWSLRKSFVQFTFNKLSGHAPVPHPELRVCIDSTVKLAQEIRRKTGVWPALLVATSHPDTEGPDEWLRFEVMAQGIAVADAVVESQNPGQLFYSHPKCLLAIDPFALDTLSAPIAGFYAGWMHQIYLAYDRQAEGQSWIQRNVLLRNTGYTHITRRLLSNLRNDIPVLMAYGGGLPYNARLLYAAREFVQRLPITRWAKPKRAAQLELIQLLLTPQNGVWVADKGLLLSELRSQIAEMLRRWGVPLEKVESELKNFEAEFRRSVPCRVSFLKILYSRLVKKGKPLIILPITHCSGRYPIVPGKAFSLDPQGQNFEPFCQLFANIFDSSSSNR